MKTLKFINYFALALPFLCLMTYPFFEVTSLILTLYSGIFIGLIQMSIGLIILFKYPHNHQIRLYWIFVILFFSSWFFTQKIGNQDIISFTLFIVSLSLAIYLTIIINKTTSL
jgi:hypothetical protein